MTDPRAAAWMRRVCRMALLLGMAGGLAAIAYEVPLSAAQQNAAERTVEVQAQGAGARPANAANTEATEPAPRAVLQRYCFACHNQRTLTAGLALDVLDMNEAGEHPEVWEAVINKLRTGAMPPAGRPRPDNGHLRRSGRPGSRPSWTARHWRAPIPAGPPCTA